MAQRRSGKSKKDESSDDLIVMETQTNNSSLKNINDSLEDDCIVIKESTESMSLNSKNVDDKKIPTNEENTNEMDPSKTKATSSGDPLSNSKRPKKGSSTKQGPVLNQLQKNEEFNQPNTQIDIQPKVDESRNIPVVSDSAINENLKVPTNKKGNKSSSSVNKQTVNQNLSSKQVTNPGIISAANSIPKETASANKQVINPGIISAANSIPKETAFDDKQVINQSTVLTPNNKKVINPVTGQQPMNTSNTTMPIINSQSVTSAKDKKTANNKNTILPTINNQSTKLTDMCSLENSIPSKNEQPLDDAAKTVENINAKYIVKFKSGDFEKTFYLNDDDPIELIYKDLFKTDTEKKLLCEDMKLSRFLLASESGFFPGVNYIYLPEGESITISSKNVTVKINENTEDDIKVEVKQSTKVKDVLARIKTDSSIDFVLMFNGEILDDSVLLDTIVENGVVLDAIDKKLVK